MIGAVEQKCCAYVFLILSLLSILKSQLIRASIFGGLAIAFHVLVGGWGMLALTGTLVFHRSDYKLRDTLGFIGLFAFHVPF